MKYSTQLDFLKQIKLFLAAILFFFQANSLSSQVVLTQSDVPKFGSSMVMSQIYEDTFSLNRFTFSKVGTNNIWDFTKLPKERYDTIHFFDPKTSNYDIYESATFTLRYNSKDGPAFYRIEDKGMYCLGEVIIFNPFVGPFQGRLRPDQLTKLFPYKLGDSTYSQVSKNTPKYRGIYDGLEVDSVYHILNHTANAKVIASGNIILPFGTFPAILERIDIIFRDSVFVKDGNSDWISNNSPTGAPYIYYHWYIQGSLWHVARAVQLYANYNDYIEYAENAMTTGLNKALTNESNISIQINQELRKLKIEGTSQFIGATYTIGNVFGQNFHLTGSVNDDFIDISALSSGMYYIKIQTKHYTEVVKKIIVF